MSDRCWVMTGSFRDGDDTLQIQEEEEEQQQLADPPPSSELCGGSTRCRSRSESPRARARSSVSTAASQAGHEEHAAPDSDGEFPSTRLPERHSISSEVEKGSACEEDGTEPSWMADEEQQLAEDLPPQGLPPGLGDASAPEPWASETAGDPFEATKEGQFGGTSRGGLGLGYFPFVLAALSVCVAALTMSCGAPPKEEVSPAATMLMHSARHLNLTEGVSTASIAVLQDKLKLKQMQVDLDTQVFTAKREAARDLITSTCNLPEKICKSMAAAVSASDMKFHKKSSIPLDSNEGSYYGVWMWVKEVGGEGDVQVAFKAASLSYQLRDVVTYREQIDDEPVIRCETLTNNLWFIRGTEERCREVSRRRTVTPMPVFKQAIMNPEEMQLVDTLMESMLAKKVLENTDVPQVARAEAMAVLAVEAEP